MTAITYTYGRGWHPVRDTGNPTRDPLADPAAARSFTALGWVRYHALRGRPLAKLVAAEKRIATPEGYIERMRRVDPMVAEIFAPVFDGMKRMALLAREVA